MGRQGAKGGAKCARTASPRAKNAKELKISSLVRACDRSATR